MATKNQIQKRDWKRALRITLKKLAACGLLASGMLLVGSGFMSNPVFAVTPGHISENDTTGYDGASDGNSLLLEVKGGVTLSAKENGNTYYQNLLKVTGNSDLTLSGVGTGEGDTFKAKYFAIITNTDQVHVKGNLTLNQGSYIGVPTDVDITATKAHADGTGYSVGSVYVGGGNLTLNGGKTSNAKSGIYAGDVMVEGKKVTGDNPELIGGNVTLGKYTEIITTGSFWANSSNNYSGEYAKITLNEGATLDVGGTFTFRDLVNGVYDDGEKTYKGGTVHARGNATGNTVTINSGTVNFYDYVTITGRDATGIKNDSNLNAYNGLRVAMTLTNNFKATLYGETVIEGMLINNGKTSGETLVPAELYTNGNTRVTMKPNYKNEINNSGIWTSTGNITSEASLKNTGTLTTTGSMSFSEKFNKDSLICYEEGKPSAVKIPAFVNVDVTNSGTLEVCGAFSSTTGFTNKGTASIGSNVDLIGTLSNSSNLTTGGSVNLSNQIAFVNQLTPAEKAQYIEKGALTETGARTVAYMGTKGVGQGTNVIDKSYYWAAEEYLVGNVENSGVWTANGSISTMAAVNNSGTLNVTGNLVTTQDNTVYTVQNYQNTSGQSSLQASESLSGVFDSKITNKGNLNVSGYVTAAGGFENSGTATIGGALDVTGALTNASGATLTTNGKVKVVSGATRNVLTLDSEKKDVTFTTQEAYQETAGGEVKYQGKVENLKVDNWSSEEVSLTAEVKNEGTWNVNGGIQLEGDTTLTNSGTLNANANVEVGNLSNTKDINVKGNLTVTSDAVNDGTITGKTSEASVQVGGDLKSNDGITGTITGMSSVTVTGDVASQNITMLNANSIVTAGTWTGSSVSNVGKLRIDGDASLTDTNSLTGTGTGSSCVIAGALSGDGTVTNFDNVSIGGDLSGSTTLTDLGYVFVNGDVTDTVSGTGIGTMVVTGDVTTSGVIVSDGSNSSLFQANSITNSGNIQGFSKLIVATGMSNAEGGTMDVEEISGTSIENKGSMTVGGDVVITDTEGTLDNKDKDATMTVYGDLRDAGNLNNEGTIELANTATVVGDVTNVAGANIAGLTENASLQTGAGMTNAGTVTNMTSINVEKTLINQGTIAGRGKDSIIKAGELENITDQTISQYEIVDVKGDIINNGSIIGTGEGANIKATKITNYSGNSIDNFEKLDVENLENLQDGKITGTGAGSTLTVNENLKNTKTIEQYEKVTAGSANVSGTITGTGTGSFLKTGSLEGENKGDAFSGKIENFQTVENGADLINAGTIAGTGAHSMLNQTGNLTNTDAGTIEKFQDVNVTEKLTNQGTLAVENVTAKSIDNNGENASVKVGNSLIVAENATNDGTIEGTSADATVEIGGDLKASDGKTGTVKELSRLDVAGEVNGQSITTADGGSVSANDVKGNTSVANVNSMVVKGELDTNGTIAGAGAGSLLNVKTLTNNSDNNITGFQTITAESVTNKATLTGMGTGSQLTTNALENKEGKKISGFQEINATGVVTNAGKITGTGAGSKASFGSMNNSGEISDIESIAVKEDMTNAGKLLVMDGVTVGGKYTNDNSGTINTAIQDNGVGRIDANTAEVNGGTVNIDGRMRTGQKYVFLNTEKGLNVTEELTANNSTTVDLFHAATDYDDNSYWAYMKRDKEYGGDIEGLTPNQISTGNYIDRIAYSMDMTTDAYKSSDLYKVLKALDADSEENTARNLDQLSGSAYANQGILGMQNTWFAHQNLANFVRPMDCELYPDGIEGQKGHGVWGGFVGNTGNYKSDGNGLATTYDSAGVIVGYDFFSTNNFRGGIYFQYQNVGNTERDVAATTKADHYDLGLYGLYENGYGYILASGNISYGNYKTTRLVSFGSADTNINREHDGSRGSFQQSLRLETAPTFAFGGGNLVLHPFVAMTYIHMNLDDLTESGSEEYVTALATKGGDLNSLRPELGARVSSCFSKENCVFGFNGRASWVHEFCDTYGTIENRFSNPDGQAFGDSAASYIITGTDLGRDYAWLGLGMTADTQSRIGFFGGYDLLINNQATVHTGNVGISYKW